MEANSIVSRREERRHCSAAPAAVAGRGCARYAVRQYRSHGLLHDLVRRAREAQRLLLPTRLRDHDPSHGLRAIAASVQPILKVLADGTRGLREEMPRGTGYVVHKERSLFLVPAVITPDQKVFGTGRLCAGSQASRPTPSVGRGMRSRARSVWLANGARPILYNSSTAPERGFARRGDICINHHSCTAATRTAAELARGGPGLSFADAGQY